MKRKAKTTKKLKSSTGNYIVFAVAVIILLLGRNKRTISDIQTEKQLQMISCIDTAEVYREDGIWVANITLKSKRHVIQTAIFQSRIQRKALIEISKMKECKMNN